MPTSTRTTEGPTIYAQLMDVRTDEPRRELEGRIKALTQSGAVKLSEWMADQLRKAYVAGVADGYVQGVAAESKREVNPK